MTMVLLAPCSVDQSITNSVGHCSGHEAVAFDRLGSIGVAPREDLFAGSSSETAAAKQLFLQQVSKAAGFPIGMIRLNNVYLAGPTGIIIDRDRGLYFHGQAIGWGSGIDMTTAQLRGNFNAWTSEDGKVRLDCAAFDSAPSYDSLRIVSAAGFAVYGHWLIDVIPRLLLCKASSRDRQAPFYGPKLGDWTYALAKAAGVDIGDRIQSRAGELVFAKTVEIPTFIRHGQVLDETRSVAAWAKLKSAMHVHDDVGADLLYVSRANWKRGRSLSNVREVEGWVRSHGFRVIYPETLTFQEQVRIFARARLVIGEDGSGLHNSVFAEHHVHIGVISMGRINTYHASIANAKRHSVSYLPAMETRQDGGTSTWTLGRDVLEQYLTDIDFQRSPLRAARPG